MTAPPQHVGVRGVPFACDLARFGGRPALITADATLSYAELAVRVAEVGRRLEGPRRLVMLAAANTVESVVTYLAALAHGHPILLATAGNGAALRSLADAYDPDTAVLPDGSLHPRGPEPVHDLHPDLALLLSTSGSTGSPKLVRLSRDNLQANAESIASYLALSDGDRAVTTLPMSYCYGLSVINSHLLRGASLVLTERSVAEAEFWDLFRETRATSFAGVPYTFELLDRVGFDTMALPHLRYITQAGGRLPADRVAHYAELGRRDRWDLFVMYGQTEATARMAFLPPRYLATHPQAIGVPVPGGSFQLEPVAEWDEPGTGELVYSGPNVMLGYAESPADLASGRTVTELRTGDIARRDEAGLYEVIGRRSRFLKIYGLRIDPQRIESSLAGHGHQAYCTGTDDELIIAVTGPVSAGHVQRLVTGEFRLPARAVRVHVLDELPRLATGKPDYQAVKALAGQSPVFTTDLCELYSEVLGRSRVTEDDTFTGLGGDSLSYVEMSIQLERVLGALPDGWDRTPIRDLRSPVKQPRWRRIEAGVALRAVTILTIVAGHIGLFPIKGGAHILLGLAGYNFARFQLGTAERRARATRILASARRVAVPSVLWIGLMAVLTGGYGTYHVLLAMNFKNGFTKFWFVEALVYLLVIISALLMIPGFDRMERRHPFGLPVALFSAGLLVRFDLFGARELFHPYALLQVAWLFMFGWAAAKASAFWQRLLLSMAAVATVPGYIPTEPKREIIILAGLLFVVWVRTLPSLPLLNWAAGLVAGNSLFIYLSHFDIYPMLDQYSQVLAFAVSVAGGIAFGALYTRARNELTRLIDRRMPHRRAI